MLLGKSRKITPERMKKLSQSRNDTPVEDVSSGESKFQSCKEQYCIGTWNVRSMNRGKLNLVKQEMTRVNINILGISELKWTGMVNLIPMTIIPTTVGKNRRRQWHPTPVLLPGKSHGRRSLVGCSPWGR